MATPQGLNLTIPIDVHAEHDADVMDLFLKFGYLKKNMDVFFLIIIGIIIFFMQCGFALLEAGAVRSKNTTNILIKNILDVFIGGLAYWIVGYPLAFGEESNFFIGYSGWVSIGVDKETLAKWFFQFVFAATTATIVSGSMAERCGFGAYLVYSTVLTGFIYPVVSHWCWTDIGWLSARNYQDFAGSGVVHLTGGIAALVGCVILGPRIGRFGPNPHPIPGHSVPLSALGGFILLFGFLAFNGGSQASISQDGDAASIAVAVVNTVLSGCTAGITVLLLHWVAEPCMQHAHHWSFLLTLNGALTGMVAACAGCDAMPTWGAVATGAVAGLVYYCVHHLMIKMHVDDPLDAVAVHGGGGIWGLIAVALFREEGIVFQGEDAIQILSWNVAGMLAIIGWSGVLCIIMFSILRCLGLLRVPKEMELKGLDIIKHGEPAYPAEAWREGQYAEGVKPDEPPRVLGSDLPPNMNPSMNTPWGYYSQPPMYQPPGPPMYWTLPDPRRYHQQKNGRYAMPRPMPGPARPSEFYPQHNIHAVPSGAEYIDSKDYYRLRSPKTHNGISNEGFRHDDETSGL